MLVYVVGLSVNKHVLMHYVFVQFDGQFNLHVHCPFQSNPHYIVLFIYRETRLHEFDCCFFIYFACILNTSFIYCCLSLSGIMLFKCFHALCIKFVSRELCFSKSGGSVVLLEFLFEEIIYQMFFFIILAF